MFRFMFYVLITVIGIGLWANNSANQNEQATLNQIVSKATSINESKTPISQDQIAFNRVIEDFVLQDKEQLDLIRDVQDKASRSAMQKELRAMRGRRWKKHKPKGLVKDYFGEVISLSTSTIWGGPNHGKTRLDIEIKGNGSGAIYKSDGWASVIIENKNFPTHWGDFKEGDKVQFSGSIFIKENDPSHFSYYPKLGSSWPEFSFVFNQINLQ